MNDPQGILEEFASLSSPLDFSSLYVEEWMGPWLVVEGGEDVASRQASQALRDVRRAKRDQGSQERLERRREASRRAYAKRKARMAADPEYAEKERARWRRNKG